MLSKIALSAVILAGGDSKRMGTNKAFLTFNRVYLIDYIFEQLHRLFIEVLIVTDREKEFKHLNAKIVSDMINSGEKNALRGIHSGLFHASNEAAFFVACDMPFLSESLIYEMSKYAADHDAVLPRVDGYYQPLFAFYNRRVLNMITRSLEQKCFKVTDLYSGLNIKEVNKEMITTHDPDMRSFFNVNTRDDYEKAKKIYATRTGI